MQYSLYTYEHVLYACVIGVDKIFSTSCMYTHIFIDLLWACDLFVVVNGSLTVPIGESVIVRSGQRILIDCESLIEVVRNLTGSNPRVTWEKNDTGATNLSQVINIIISPNKTFLILNATLNRGGELGNSGCYTCRVCAGDSNIDCINDTSCQTTCGKRFV